MTCSFNCCATNSWFRENYAASTACFTSGLCMCLQMCTLVISHTEFFYCTMYAFFYISIISKFLVVKIVSHLIFSYLRYPLCYCLILAVGFYENASKDLLKIIFRIEEGLHAVFAFTSSSKWCSFQWSLRISFGRWYEKRT